jgi:hypothetical protein
MTLVAALHQFKFFTEYEDDLVAADWLALALSAKVESFEPYKPICQLWDTAVTVYMNIYGNIGVTTDRRNAYNKKFMEEHQVAVIKPGVSFGEIGVLYGASR